MTHQDDLEPWEFREAFLRSGLQDDLLQHIRMLRSDPKRDAMTIEDMHADFFRMLKRHEASLARHFHPRRAEMRRRTTDPDAIWLTAHYRDAVEQIRSTASDIEKKVIDAVCIEGLSHSSAAQRLGTTASSIRAIFYRLRRKISKKVRAREGLGDVWY